MDTGFLYDDEEWEDAQGTIHRIEDLEYSHAFNIVNLLERNAEDLAHADSAMMLGMSMPGGSVALGDVMSAIAHAEQLKADPLGWLRDTPVMLALRARLERGGLTIEDVRACRCAYHVDHGWCTWACECSF